MNSRSLLIAAIVGALLAAMYFLPQPMLARIDMIWIAIISAASLNLLIGLAGQVSLGQAAFMAIGAYAGVVLQRSGVDDLLVGMLCGALLSALIGLLVGLPSLRLRGFYLALTTLALHFAVIFVIYRYQRSVGGEIGFRLNAPTLFGYQIAGVKAWYVLLSVIGVLTLLVFHNLTRSKIGRAWVAVRDRDLAASIIGINVVYYKLMAFVVSSFVAGMAGALQAFYIGSASHSTYSLEMTVSFIAMIIIGGLGSVVIGSILGAVIVTQLPFLIQDLSALASGGNATNFVVFDLQTGAFGLIIVGFLLLEPDGLVGIWQRIQRRGRRIFAAGENVHG